MNNVHIGIFSNVNLDLLQRPLEKEHQIYFPPGYGQWIQETISPSEELRSFHPDAIFIILDGSALIANLSELGEIKTLLSNTADHCMNLARLYPSAKIFVSTIDIRPTKILPADTTRPEHQLMEFWESSVAQLTRQASNIHLFDLRGLIENLGRENVYSDKMWYLGSIPYNMLGITALSSKISDKIREISLTRKKVLVTDLDNTLWGGVLGEDGEEGISIGNDHEGAIYRDTQLRIKDLTNMGVLLAIVSKNNYDDVLHVLATHTQMILRPDDFVAIMANWDDKAYNIQKIAQDLNLGLDSFVFLDDNPVEREAVKQTLPDVTVADFPTDITKLPRIIENLAQTCFPILTLTTEDIAKTEMYQQEMQRKSVLNASASMEDYLRSLEIKITLGEMTEEQLDRVSQLTQKTNQFNLVTNRYSPEEIRTYANKPENYIYTAKVSDRFGDSGLVFLMMISTTGTMAHVDNLLMSCRVMGRHIEDAVLTSVEKHLSLLGVSEITAEYIPTRKNVPVINLLERLGYEVVNIDPSGTKYYRRVLGVCVPDRKMVSDIEWRA